MIKIYLPFLFLFISSFSLAQNLSIGAWREHLPYTRANTVVDGVDKIFCATDDGLFSFHKEDNSLKRYSKLSGLNDFGVSSIEYSATYRTLIIAYSNSNIDLVNDDGRVQNLSDIKRKNIPGNKVINRIRINGRYAYLACGFGIVVLDLEKKEIKDTYYIDTDGASMNVNEVVTDANWFYAAAEKGIYRAPVNSPNLNNFSEWSIVFPSTGKNYFNLIESFAGNIVANLVTNDNNGNYISDSTYKSIDGLTWINNSMPLSNNNQTFSFRVSNNVLLVTNNYSVSVFDPSYNRIQYLDGSVYPNTNTRDAFLDTEQNMWIADHDRGLIKWNGNTLIEEIHPEGPISSLVSDIGIQNGNLWITHSGKSLKWQNAYSRPSVSKLVSNSWSSYTESNVISFDTTDFFDNMSIAIDPSDAKHVFIGSGGDGLMDFYDNNVRNYYREYNSTLKPMVGNPFQVKVHGISFDDSGNLWVVNSGVSSFINVLMADGQWLAYDFSGIGTPFAGKLFIDSYNQIWVQMFGNGADGLMAYNTNKTITNKSDDNFKLITKMGEEDLAVYAMAEDLDGQLWLGTSKGIGVIYSPSALSNGGDVSVQQILIKQDNTYQYLLETETITALAVDGANRKWIGTDASGLYLVSADGQQQVQHFTPDNSPLFSNTITALAIDKTTGEVYIGTDKGLISYQSDAINGEDKCADVMVYPNPVRENYEGSIAIKGVISNSNIKITDVSGTLVFQGKALGGQAVWTGRDLKGERAHTGVYLVFSTDEEGQNACVTKLLLVN